MTTIFSCVPYAILTVLYKIASKQSFFLCFRMTKITFIILLLQISTSYYLASHTEMPVDGIEAHAIYIDITNDLLAYGVLAMIAVSYFCMCAACYMGV